MCTCHLIHVSLGTHECLGQFCMAHNSGQHTDTEMQDMHRNSLHLAVHAAIQDKTGGIVGIKSYKLQTKL